MIIIGIDPGIARTGYGVIEYKDNKISLLEIGIVKTNPKDNISIRLKSIYDGVSEVIAIFKPDYFAIESVFLGKNFATAIKLGQARGVAILAAGNAGIEISEYSPREIKQNITGNGNATKEQVAFMVKTILKLEALSGPSDSSDAAAIAISHINFIKFNNRLNNVRIK